MDDMDDSQIGHQREEPDYTKKDFRRAAEDLNSCLQEALEFFPKFEKDFSNETKEIKKYGDEELLNIIWERKVQHFENGPRATPSNTQNNSRNNGRHNGNHDEASNSSVSGIKSLQHRVQLTVDAMLDCRYPEPVEDEGGLQIRAEEVRDFEERMRKTAYRLYNSLGSISHDVHAFRAVTRDLKTMSQDLNLFPLNLWKADGGEAEQSDPY
jgi:hypothetical protein